MNKVVKYIVCGGYIMKLYGAIIDKLRKTNKKITIKVCLAVLVVVCIICGSVIFNNPILKFKSNIKSDKCAEAIKIYDDKIKGDSDKEDKVNSFLKDQTDKIEKAFKDEKIDYTEANKRLETIKNTNLIVNNVADSFISINKLNDSRTSFKKGEEFVKNNDFVSAIKEYNNVIPEDSNYKKATEQIKNNQKKYKLQVLKNAEASANSKDYDKATELLKEATLVLQNDVAITTKLAIYEKQMVENLKSKQLVFVESSKIIVQDSTYKGLYPDMIQVIIKNVSSKTVKNINVGCLGYDKNGYPLKIKTQFGISDGDYEFVGKAEDVNIIKGGTFGQHSGFNLDEYHGISKVLACIKNATFYDGTTWDNPYYERWIEQYKEKPLK